MSGERTNVPDDRRIMFDDDRVTLDERLAAAAKRNKQTADCNGTADCRAAVHLSICKAGSVTVPPTCIERRAR